MSKEIVALNNLSAYLLAPEEEGGKKYTYDELVEMLIILKKAITPPTFDEVRKTLSEHFKGAKVNVYGRRFEYERIGTSSGEIYETLICQWDYETKRIELYQTLPPHVAKIVIDFYVELANKE